MFKITYTGSGVGDVFDSPPAIGIEDALFIYDIKPDNLQDTLELLSSKKWNNVSLFQIERFNTTTEEFSEALGKIIDYAIFKNQDLLDKLFAVTTTDELTNAANEVWPTHAKEITKFRGRKWPDDKFVKDFIPIEGSGSVSPPKEKIDMNDIVSWFFELESSEGDTAMDFPFTPPEEGPVTEDDLPIPVDNGVPVPQMPENPDGTPWVNTSNIPSSGGDEGGGGATTYTIHYTWHHYYVDMPVQESHAKPMNAFVAANLKPQKHFTLDHYKMTACWITADEPEPDDGGGA